MTEKRFYVTESNLIDGYCVFDKEKKYAFSPKPRKADCLNDAHILNELNDENKRLNQTNQELYDKLQLTMSEKSLKGGEVSILKRENEQLKQFQDRVFTWIDMHLQRLPTLRDDEFRSDNEFADPSLYSGAIQILETMKRELKGDVE